MPRLVLVGYVGLALSQPHQGNGAPWGLGLGCLVCQPDEPQVSVARQQGAAQVSVVRQGDGSYEATLSGHFTVTAAGDHPFRKRLLVLFLRLLDEPGATRGGRRTRDGRTPFVRQLQLAAWFGVPQPDISRWLKYWQTADWANLRSLHSAAVLTAELVGRIVEVCATFPTWGVARVYQPLLAQGLAVSEPQVPQAVQQSGWQRLQQTLRTRYDLSAPVLALRDGWLVAQLPGQLCELLGHLEAGRPLPTEMRTALADLTTLAGETATLPPPIKALPWLWRREQLLFGDWQTLTDGQVRCPACGSDQVGRKSATPRLKKYYDATHQVCEVGVCRYYCRNAQCAQGSFTNLPRGLLPYSRDRSETHLLALQMYAWGYATYRRTGTALGVASLTAWRWVSAWVLTYGRWRPYWGSCSPAAWSAWTRSSCCYPRIPSRRGKCGAGCTSTWRLMLGPTICCTLPSIPTTTRTVRRPFCSPCGPRVTTRKASSPICVRITARSSHRSFRRPCITRASSMPHSRPRNMSRTLTAQTMSNNIQKPCNASNRSSASLTPKPWF